LNQTGPPEAQPELRYRQARLADLEDILNLASEVCILRVTGFQSQTPAPDPHASCCHHDFEQLLLGTRCAWQ
jgi:hypothetical protein